jgi:hypothetical protein
VKSEPPHSSNAGRWYLAGLGLLIAAAGAVFVFLMARSFERAREMRNWPQVPCVILSSETEERRHDPQSPAEFRVNVTFGYEWQGVRRTSDRPTWRGSSWTSKPDVIEFRSKEYTVGQQTVCYVNPADPDFAILKPDSLAPGYSIWFPALFVVGGLGITIRATWPGRPAR